MKAVLMGKFIALNAYVGKEERSKINHLTFHFRKVKKEHIKSKVSRRKEIIKFRVEGNSLVVQWLGFGAFN